MELEWDQTKRESNLDKHGFDFLDARTVLNQPHLLKRLPYADELRWMAIGILHDVEVTIIYTKREESIRIISMRRARHEERRAYHALYG
jgi:uncharacterized DUF497 family protein